MIDPNTAYSASEVAEQMFGRSADWFYRARPRLYAEGFPRPMSGIGRPRWWGAALIAWADRSEIAHAKGENVVDYTACLAMRAQEAARSGRTRPGNP